MQATLLFHTPLSVCSHATRTCWQSLEKGDCGGEEDKELIDRVGNKFKHASTLEHLNYNFYIQEILKARLQELARHRRASFSVKSTRYTLKEFRNEAKFRENDFENAGRYLVFCGNEAVDNASIRTLENLRELLRTSISLDLAKYCLPENYKTELTFSINTGGLQNFLSLRSLKSALWEIGALVRALLEALPKKHCFTFEHCMQD